MELRLLAEGGALGGGDPGTDGGFCNKRASCNLVFMSKLPKPKRFLENKGCIV